MAISRRARTFLTVVGSLGVAAAAGAAWAGDAPQPPLRMAQAETAPAVPAMGAPAAGQAAAAPVAASSEETKALWAKHCASCHGADGKADTKTGKLLKVRDLTDPAVRANFDRERMIKATKEGVKKEGSDKLVMKGFAEKLSDAEISALIDHIYSLGQ